MGQPSALFLRIPMSKVAFDKWMASPVKHVEEYGDWKEMNPVMAAHFDEWADSFHKFRHRTISELINAAADRSEFFCCEYDDDAGAAFVADVAQDSNPAEIAAALAAFRSAEAFIDRDAVGYIYIYPASTGGDPEALMKVERDSSKFLPTGDTSPDVLYFINEAEEFIEALQEEDDV